MARIRTSKTRKRADRSQRRTIFLLALGGALLLVAIVSIDRSGVGKHSVAQAQGPGGRRLPEPPPPINEGEVSARLAERFVRLRDQEGAEARQAIQATNGSRVMRVDRVRKGPPPRVPTDVEPDTGMLE